MTTPSFFRVVCHELAPLPSLTGACIGFERKVWRSEQFSKELLRYLPEFCLTYSERKSINDSNCVSHIAKAAKLVYNTDKYKKRGEFGELILHMLLRQTRGTEPAISKLYFKDAANDTVKGFDAIHVLATKAGLELWLGEVKFYANINKAISDVVEELGNHFQTSYLKNEFALILNKVDPTWESAAQLKRLLHENVSLDEIFSTIVVPVLLTYESSVTKAHSEMSAAYQAAITAELRKHQATFARKNPVLDVRVELFLLPMQNKQELVEHLHKRLEALQLL